MLNQIKARLTYIYGSKISDEYFQKFIEMLKRHKYNPKHGEIWSERDVFLITYGDSLLKDGEKPLQTLHHFAQKYLKDAISIVHILPFFPYSSDDGFSVIDFKEVNDKLGNWEDIEAFRPQFKLMADLVANHISASSQWFKDFVEQKAPGKDYIYTVENDFDTRNVVRPRSSALLTPIATKNGVKSVWTTFSPDQIDLNYTNPDLMMEMLEILLSYLDKGISVIRLDAIAFLWKRSGSACLHEKETHEAVKLMRDVIEYCAPGTILLTETNVPHKENLSYFGAGDEAHMVYQFALPPMLLHALHTGDSQYLNKWAKSLVNPGYLMTYFNFTASHDGIGVRPLEGLLPEKEKEALYDKMKAFGGEISTRKGKDGKNLPYELNITYYDAMKGDKDGEDEWQIERFINAQTIMLSLQGIPALYIHSLLGTHNDLEGMTQSGQKRSINRHKWNIDEIEGHLNNPQSSHAKVFNELTRILEIRRQRKAFHPEAEQKVIDLDPNVFSFIRYDPQSERKIVIIANLTKHSLEHIELTSVSQTYIDLLTDTPVDSAQLDLAPYQVVWLQKKGDKSL